LVGTFAPARAQSPSKSKSKGKKSPAKKDAQEPVAVKSDVRIERLLAPIRDEHHLPGMIGAIVTGDRLTAMGAVGIRKIGATEPITVTDKVHLGSDTKAMTATMIGTLVDEGKLSWKTTIRDVFPDVAPQLDPQHQEVTLSHLLTHRAGLPHDPPWGALRGNTPTEKRRSILTTTLVNPPQSRPGSTYAYSNVGYALAGLMAEQVTGQSWETLMSRRLFTPLGMKSAGFGAPGRPGGVTQPWGHRVSNGQTRPSQEDNPPAMGPAGTVHCSVADWARFASLHLAGARGRSTFLKPSTFKALQTPPPGFDYAGGWYTAERTWAGGRAFNHNGSNTLWFATIWLAPARNLAFLAVTNQGGKEAENAVDQAIVALIRTVGRFG
jgi:CubicO group peptidase (beta-lactamase class C family)